MVLSCIVSEIRRLIGKNCLFLLPLSHSELWLPMFLLEFRAEVNRQETTVTGLSYSEDPMIVARVVFDMIPACDGRTDGRTDGIYHNYYSAVRNKLCWRDVNILNIRPMNLNDFTQVQNNTENISGISYNRIYFRTHIVLQRWTITREI